MSANSDRDTITLADYYLSDDRLAGELVQPYLHLSAAMTNINKSLADNSGKLQIVLLSSGFEALIPDVHDEPPAFAEYCTLCDEVLLFTRKYLEATKAKIAEELTYYRIDASLAPPSHFYQFDRLL